MTKRRMLMAVYNPIEFDGRVKRACACIAPEFELTLVCLPSANEYRNDAFRIERLAPAGGGRIARLVSFWWQIARTARRLRAEVVYVHDFFLPLAGWMAARVCGARLIYDAHELIVPVSGVRLTPKERLFYWCEQFTVSKADLVIAANPERAEVMRSHYALEERPTAVRNIPPAPTSRSTDAEVVARFPGLRKDAPSDVHLVYMGDVCMARGLRLLVESLEFLPSNYKLVCVGGGPDLPDFRRIEASDPEHRIRVTGVVPHDQVFDLVRQADIGVVSYSMSGINNILCAPNKVFEYAQAGLPMVATCQPTIRAIFDKWKIGALVGCDGVVTPQEIAKAVQEVGSHRDHYASSLVPFLEANTWQREAEVLLSAVRTACAD
ncbi:MAG: glycosyltransferase [Planctomycetota bacterium]|nr:glycosyltransferase [Planctomycetota bacterium]